MYYPDYKSVENPDIRGQYENFWGQTLDPKRGLTVVEIIDAIHAGEHQGHVHHGRESGDVGSRPEPCPRRARHARASRGAGHLPDRDGVARRCRAAGIGACREARHLHQHQPPGPDRPAGARSARRRAAGLGADRRPCPAHRPRLELRARLGGLCRDGAGHAVAAATSPGIASTREDSVIYPADGPDVPGNEIVFTSRLPDRRRARPHRAGRPAAARRGAGRGISAGADDRPHARTLAYRRDDAARRRARRDRAAGHRRHEPLRDRTPRALASAT